MLCGVLHVITCWFVQILNGKVKRKRPVIRRYILIRMLYAYISIGFKNVKRQENVYIQSFTADDEY